MNTTASSTVSKRLHDKEDNGDSCKSSLRGPQREKRPKLQEDPDEMPGKLDFFVKDGIQHLAPYWTSYRTWTKRRWLGRTFEEVFSREFLSTNKNYARVACKMGRIFVNGKQMTDPEHILRDNERITHIGHRHEHPVLALPIDIVADTDDVLVVNKPPGMPVHACGQYKAHTVLATLAREHGITGLRVVHRLDRATSGVLIFAKNYAADLELKSGLLNQDWKKEYVCRVAGEFPDEEVECEQPLGILSPSMGIQCVREDGKNAKSRFRKLWSNGVESVVSCRIATGRTHQIRVHLQWLGHPILSDTIYNHEAWGPTKGKFGDYGKPLEQLRIDVQDSHKAANWQEDLSPEYIERMEQLAAASDVQPEPEDVKMESRPNTDPICLGCHVTKKVPSMDHFRLHLHCWRYETTLGTFESPLPEWAQREETGESEQEEVSASCGRRVEGVS